MVHKIGSSIKNDIKDNKFTYFGLFIFYIIGIVLGSFAVNDLDFQQQDDMTKYLNGFLKLLNSSGINAISLFKMSLLDNFKIILLFWGLGFTVIGIPIYYIIIGMRGFTTGFSSGVIIGVLETKGILISTICFLPKEIIVLPCLIALGVNGIKLSRYILKNVLKKTIKDENGIMKKIGVYCFSTVLFSIFLLLATLLDAYTSANTINLLCCIS